MKRIRGRLTYANVISTLALFLVLGGGAAIAATELEPNSVATVHIQPQAVTGVKIKSGAVISSRLADEAVTEGKIANGAVTGDKIADGAVGTSKIGNGAVTEGKLDPGLPFARVVERIRGTQTVAFPKSGAAISYPLDNPTFTQPAGETHLYVGSAQVEFPDNCNPGRATALLMIDEGQGALVNELVGDGSYVADNGGPGTFTFQFSPAENSHGATSGAPASPTQHTFSIQLLSASCNSFAGTGDRVKMTGAQIDVIGIR